MIVRPPFSGRHDGSRRWAILKTRSSGFSRRRMRLAMAEASLRQSLPLRRMVVNRAPLPAPRHHRRPAARATRDCRPVSHTAGAADR